MSKVNSSIFRPEAVRRYLQRRGRTVFPVYPAPRLTLCAGLLSVILAAGALLAATARVPVYARGVAVLRGQAGGGAPHPGGAEAAIFMPPEFLSEMRVGQRVFFKAGPAGWLSGGRITAVTPEAMRPAEARVLLQLAALPAGVIRESAAALAGPVPHGMTSRDERGDVVEVRVEIGERPLLSFGR